MSTHLLDTKKAPAEEKRSFMEFRTHKRGHLENDGSVERSFYADFPRRSGRHGELRLTLIRAKQIIYWFRIYGSIGTRGSETPWDFHLNFLWWSIVIGFGMGGKFAHWINNGKWYASPKKIQNTWYSSSAQIGISDGSLYGRWDFREGKKRKRKMNMKKPNRTYGKRYFSVPINPVEILRGPVRNTFENVVTIDTVLILEGKFYPIRVVLQRVLTGRTKVDKSKHKSSWTLDVEALAGRGIPVYVDNGGWKGSEVYGWHVPINSGVREGWEVDAHNAIMASVLKMRADNHYRPEVQTWDPVEAQESAVEEEAAEVQKVWGDVVEELRNRHAPSTPESDPET